MANLLGQNIGSNYRGILNLDATTINTPLDTTLRAVTDGMGNTSPLQLSTISISFGGASGLNWDNANSRLGIGTINPTEKLSVIGNIDIPATTGKIGFYVGDVFTAYGSTAANYGMSYFNAQSTVILSGYASLRMFTTGTERLSILADGNVGIGETSPTARLTVKGDGTNPIMRLDSNSGARVISVAQSNGLMFGDATTRPSIASFSSTGAAFDLSGTAFGFTPSSQAGYSYWFANANITSTVAESGFIRIFGTFAAAAGTANFRPLNITYTINNSGAKTGTQSKKGSYERSKMPKQLCHDLLKSSLETINVV